MKIDYEVLLENVSRMIDIQEYDGMRSPGKIKMNAANLVDLYVLKERYAKEVSKAKKTNSVKED